MCKRPFPSKSNLSEGCWATERPVYANFLGSGQFLSLSMLSFFALCPVSLSPLLLFPSRKEKRRMDGRKVPSYSCLDVASHYETAAEVDKCAEERPRRSGMGPNNPSSPPTSFGHCCSYALGTKLYVLFRTTTLSLHR